MSSSDGSTRRSLGVLLTLLCRRLDTITGAVLPVLVDERWRQGQVLRDDASLWWEGASQGVDLTILTWNQFKDLFYNKYFPADVRGRLTREFMSIRQGDLSMSEFIRRFDRGCHFVPFIARDVAEKLRNFMYRLIPTIHWDVMLMRPTTYDAATTCSFKEESQKAADFPSNKGPTTGRTYVMHDEEAEVEAESDSTLITCVATYALPDSGATHSFISESFVKRVGIIPDALDLGFRVSIPSGYQMFTSKIVKRLELRLQKNTVHADFIVLPLPEFDIIMGMD
ncbi:uncharacterized protein [Primulina huaijiensis]|uniref:uncharacterized protein n=1 Tax=Primulina huaijiensis TaxID=1492673 RepID=UPI003CC759F7